MELNNLFSIYIHNAIKEWHEGTDKNYIVSGMKLHCLLFTEAQVLIVNSENNLWKTTYLLHETITEYNLQISVQKTKMMAFIGTKQNKLTTSCIKDRMPHKL
jgi:hypothetical protein